MATKKTVKPETEEQLLEQPAEEEQTEGGVKDAWDEEVSVIVPRKPKGEDQQYYICVNDRRWMVPANGKAQMLPKPVAEILQESLKAEYDADEFADHIPNRSGENPQMHGI